MTAKRETALMNRINLALSAGGVLAWRNNVGAAHTADGRFIRFGVGGPGGSDLIGVAPVVITEDMIGRQVGVACAFEVKTERGRATPAQIGFMAAVEKIGGIAAIVRSEGEAMRAIETWKAKKHDNKQG